MIALRLHDRHDLRLHEEPPPVPADGELLVRVSAVGLCGSDLHWFEEGRIGDAGLTWPLVLGHEIAGVVADGPRAGERVCLDPAIPCPSGSRRLFPWSTRGLSMPIVSTYTFLPETATSAPRVSLGSCAGTS